jgi:hypothetical protein
VEETRVAGGFIVGRTPEEGKPLNHAESAYYEFTVADKIRNSTRI